MEQIKPGTRCECSDGGCPNSGDPEGCELGCTADAVRMVEVRRYFMSDAPALDAKLVEVPMCEACAAYHESKVAR